MKILGIGVDIIDNDRFRRLIKNPVFLRKIFTSNEINNSKNITNKCSYYAKRFASKEAFSKSIGTGFRNALNFKDISIINDKLGKPSFIINDKIKKIVKNQFKVSHFNFFLSISDEKKYSLAYVILQKK
jgi:holo-[acyl-carrier protein] synthase